MHQGEEPRPGDPVHIPPPCQDWPPQYQNRTRQTGQCPPCRGIPNIIWFYNNGWVQTKSLVPIPQLGLNLAEEQLKQQQTALTPQQLAQRQ